MWGRRAGVGRQLRPVIVLAMTGVLVQLCVLDNGASAAANRELQARVLIRGIVSRVAFHYAIGSAVDLPVGLAPCASPEDRAKTYSTIKSAIEGASIDVAARASLCHPHIEEFQSLSENEKRLTFVLPPGICPKVRATVMEIVNDFRGGSFHKLLDVKAQRVVRGVFEGRPRVYGNTSGPLHFGPFRITIGGCATQPDRDELHVAMQI